MKLPKYFDMFQSYETSNGNFRLLDFECPICGKQGKIYIKIREGWAYCFHCSRNHNLYELFSEYEGVSKKETFRLISDGQDTDRYLFEENSIQQEEQQRDKIQLLELPKEACSYLLSRNIPEKTIEHFKIAYCSSNIIINDRIVYSANRIIFPIHDINGKSVSWIGRDITGNSKIKYLMELGFKINNHLYNANNIENNPDYMIVTEGVMDTLGWYRHGFKNTVATFGKKISKVQFNLLRQINPEVLFLAWDYNCYREMADLADQLSIFFKSVRIIELPEGKDADECECVQLLNTFTRAVQTSWNKKILACL